MLVGVVAYGVRRTVSPTTLSYCQAQKRDSVYTLLHGPGHTASCLSASLCKVQTKSPLELKAVFAADPL